RNPQLYIDRTRTAQRVSSSHNNRDAASSSSNNSTTPAANTMRGPSELHEAIDTLQETGHSVIKRLIQRIEWILSVYKRQSAELTCETLLQLIASDRRCM